MAKGKILARLMASLSPALSLVRTAGSFILQCDGELFSAGGDSAASFALTRLKASETIPHDSR